MPFIGQRAWKSLTCLPLARYDAASPVNLNAPLNRLFHRCLIAAGLSAIALSLSSCAPLGGGMRPGGFSTVVIDAGHGGPDNGGRSRQGLMEKNLALDTARRLQSRLRREGFRTVMTRDSDRFIELDDRVALANRYPDAILVSIHYNASPSSSPSGAETFFWRTDSYGLARRVQRGMVEESGLDSRGVTRRVLRLTRNPRIPSILCECGFLTNPSEAARLIEGSFRQRIADGIADGIVAQQARGDVGIGYSPRVRVSDDSRRRTAVRRVVVRSRRANVRRSKVTRSKKIQRTRAKTQRRASGRRGRR
jgi:N-acetylmuramoyl-L-alanine amidase